MANISDAKGRVFIYADERSVAENLFSILNSIQSEFGDYPTFYNTDLIQESRGCWSTSFVGSGRWNYSENVLAISDFMDLHVKPHSLLHTYFEVPYWKLVYKYSEYELGCSFLWDAKCTLEHIADTDLRQSLFSSDILEKFDCSPYMINEKGFFDSLDDTLESCFCWDDISDEERKQLFMSSVNSCQNWSNCSKQDAYRQITCMSSCFCDFLLNLISEASIHGENI